MSAANRVQNNNRVSLVQSDAELTLYSQTATEHSHFHLDRVSKCSLMAPPTAFALLSLSRLVSSRLLPIYVGKIPHLHPRSARTRYQGFAIVPNQQMTTWLDGIDLLAGPRVPQPDRALSQSR
jgi:hypothetical protein